MAQPVRTLSTKPDFDPWDPQVKEESWLLQVFWALYMSQCNCPPFGLFPFREVCISESWRLWRVGSHSQSTFAVSPCRSEMFSLILTTPLSLYTLVADWTLLVLLSLQKLAFWFCSASGLLVSLLDENKWKPGHCLHALLLQNFCYPRNWSVTQGTGAKAEYFQIFFFTTFRDWNLIQFLGESLFPCEPSWAESPLSNFFRYSCLPDFRRMALYDLLLASKSFLSSECQTLTMLP